MSAEMLVLMVVPLILFVVVELKYGVKAGVYAALVLTAVVAAYWYLRFGQLDELLIAEFGLLMVLGIITIKLKDSRFFKFQPVAVGVVMVSYFTVLQAMGDPILLRMVRLSVKAFPQFEQLLASPNFEPCASTSSLILIAVIAGHAALCGVAALKLGSVGWLLTRLLGYPLIIIPGAYLGVCLRG